MQRMLPLSHCMRPPWPQSQASASAYREHPADCLYHPERTVPRLVKVDADVVREAA